MNYRRYIETSHISFIAEIGAISISNDCYDEKCQTMKRVIDKRINKLNQFREYTNNIYSPYFDSFHIRMSNDSYKKYNSMLNKLANINNIINSVNNIKMTNCDKRTLYHSMIKIYMSLREYEFLCADIYDIMYNTIN